MSKTHTGEILEIGETRSVTDRFQKRRFVVDEVYTGGQYGPSHNPVPFFLTQEKCGLIDEFQAGQHVTVHYDVKSRPWMKDNVHQLDKDGDKAYFVEIQAWKIEAAVAENATPQDQEPAAEPAAQAPPVDHTDVNQGFDQQGNTGDPEPDDLPF